MAKFIRKEKEEIGSSPHDLRTIGRNEGKAVRVHIMDYDGENVHEEESDVLEPLRGMIGKSSNTWVHIEGSQDEAMAKELREMLQINDVVLSEVLGMDGRTRLVEFENGLFFSLKILDYVPEDQTVKEKRFGIALFKDVLVTYCETAVPELNLIRERIRHKRKKVSNSALDYLAYVVMDIVIDKYLFALARIGDCIEVLQDKIEDENVNPSVEIHHFKQQINFARKNLFPYREMLSLLVKLDSDYIDEKVHMYYSELQENVKLAMETSDAYREVLIDNYNMYQTRVSNRLNDIMRVLTIFSVIFIPLTFIAGVYGTNFDNIPELHHPYAYYLMWIVMILTALSMIYYFKRKKWL